MPRLNGYNASKIIKQDEILKEIPILILTASAMKDELHNLENICDGFLQKPLLRVDFIKEIMKFIRNTKNNKDIEMIDIMSINKILDFSIEMKKMSEKYRCNALFQWARKLEQSTTNFEINELTNLLHQLMKMI